MHDSRPLALAFAAGVALSAIVSCTTSAKEAGARTVLTSMNSGERRQDFEATMRVLDDHPEIVDEAYVVARNHPAMMQRFVAYATADMAKNDQLVKLAADEITRRPDSLERVSVEVIETSAQRKEARAAIDRAVMKRANATIRIISDRPDAMASSIRAVLDEAEKTHETRVALLYSMRRDAQRFTDFVSEDVELTRMLATPLLKTLAKEPGELEKVLEGLGRSTPSRGD